MERLAAEISAMNDEVLRLRDEVQDTARSRDIAERLAAGLADTAEQARDAAQKAHDLLRRRVIAVAGLLTVWAVIVAWGAIWWHQQYLNDCVTRPGFERVADPPWHCALFPNPTHNHEEPN